MKNLAVLLMCCVICSYALDEDLKREAVVKIHKFGSECVDEEKATEDDMVALVNKQTPPTHQGKCVVFCVLKKFDVMRPDGSYGAGDMEWLNKVRESDADFHDKFVNAWKICGIKFESETDNCEKAAKLFQCNIEETKKAGIDNLLL